jgi:hypothetical protein
MTAKEAAALVKGTNVTTSEPVEAFYSGYAGNDKLYFNPGDKGTFVCLSPAVTGRNRDKAVVDFDKNGEVQRVRLELKQLRKYVEGETK